MAEENDVMKNIGGDSENNLRKYLILGGGVFVLFVIGIVISKFMFSSPKTNNTAVILPPEIKNTKIQKKEDTALFNDIPVENDTQFQKPAVEKDKPMSMENDTPTQNIVEQVKKKTENIISKPKTIEVNKQQLPKVVKKQVKPVEEIIHKPKKIVKKIIRHYYIQVSAITRGKPSKKFINLLKRNNYNYRIVTAIVKGTKVQRILIGSYTYQEAKNALPKIKAKITSTAFIKKLK